VGAYGLPAGIAAASVHYGRLPLADLTAPAAELARGGVPLAEQQAYIVEILAGIVTATPECAALFAPGDRLLQTGDVFRNPELGDTLDLLGREGAAPFYNGAIATAVCDWLDGRGATLSAADLREYDVVDREPVRVGYRDTEVLLNPPPSAGGALLALALARLDATEGIPDAIALVDSMDTAQAARTPEFLDGLADPGFLEHFLAKHLGSTTHIAAIDADGMAASVTCSNGEGSGIVVPGTGIHLNNMLGEEDLNPLGFHRHESGRRLPSMMCPAAVLRDGVPELVLGSAGSNRIRSALLQTISNVVDRGMQIQDAVDAARLHSEAGTVYAEPGIDTDALAAAGYAVQPFRARNLFFGGVQAARRRAEDGALGGGGDPRRGGAVVVV
jgi:gamma-glutamyltranspeptidase/glutathione hydrolase